MIATLASINPIIAFLIPENVECSELFYVFCDKLTDTAVLFFSLDILIVTKAVSV